MARKEKIHLMESARGIHEDETVETVRTYCGLVAISYEGTRVQFGVPAVLEEEGGHVSCKRCQLAARMRGYLDEKTT